MEASNMDETRIKHDPDDPLNDRHAIFILQNAEVKEEGEEVLKMSCNVCKAVLPGSLALFDHLEEHANAMFCDQSDEAAPAAANTATNPEAAECDLVSTLSEREAERDTRPKAVSKEVSDSGEIPGVVAKFKCEHCSTSFPRKWRLIRHLVLDHNIRNNVQHRKSKFICDYCSKSFTRKHGLKRHFSEVHNLISVNKIRKVVQPKNSGVICNHCPKTFARNNLLIQHICSVHKPKNLCLQNEEIETIVCFYCKWRKFPTTMALQAHIRQVHVASRRNSIFAFNREIYTCDMCSANFKTKLAMIEHFQRKHNLKIPNGQRNQFSCELCNLNFRSITEDIQHRKSKEHLGQIKAKNAINCPVCFKTFDTLEKMIGHKNVQHSYIQCDYCGSKTKSRQLMHLHVLHHACLKIDKRNGVNSWNCNACEKQFSKREEFYTHHKSVHPYSKTFRCPECFTKLGVGNKSLWGIIQSHLAAHKRGYNGFYCFECRKLVTKYTDHQMRHNQPYMCAQCGKRFSSKRSMHEHNRLVHLKNEKYVCEVCGKSFLTITTRYQHLKIVHSKIEFTCDICGIKKKRKGLMSRHMASHQQKVQKPFVCGTCGKDFWTKLNLQRHELTHSGVKPFSCSICSRAFNQHDSMKRHMRQHTGEEPYKCKDCGKGFKQTSSLKAHIHVHHNADRKRCEICEKSFRNDVALRKHLEGHVREGKSKKKAERKTKRGGNGDKKKRNCTKST